MTEFGIDGGLEGRDAPTAGWRAYDLSAAEYVQQLDEVCTLYAGLGSDVLGVCVFNAGDYTPSRWASFEVAGVSEFEAWLREGPRTWKEEPPMADLVQMLTAELGSQFADLRAQLPDVVSPRYGKFGPRPTSGITALVAHHSAGPAWQSAQAIYDYHVKSNGWSGIGYHFLIWPNGAVRYVGSLETSRANVADHNDEVVGICFMGTYTDDVPTDAALVSGARLVKVLRAYLRRDVAVEPHRHYGGTICPGNRWQEWTPFLDTPTPEPTVDPDGRSVWDKISWAIHMAADYLDNEAKLLSEDAPQDALVRRLAAQRIRDDYGRDATRKRDAREA